MSKSKLKHFGAPVFLDERGKMYKVLGNTRIYLNRETVAQIEAKKKK